MERKIQEDTLLSLDLSSSCVGYALFKVDDRKLLNYGKIKPKVSGVTKMKYPLQQLEKMKSIASQINRLIGDLEPTYIVIEEVAGSKNRLSQKTLDGLHFIVLLYLQGYDFPFEKIRFYDVSGTRGWRTDLKLTLSDADKAANKEARKLNKSLKGSQKLPIIGPKDLSCRFANRQYGLNLDLKDNDIADAVSFGYAFLKHRFTKL